MFSWLSRIFDSKAESTDADEHPLQEIDEGSSFVFNEHMRIVLAIFVMIIGAFVMWWIVV